MKILLALTISVITLTASGKKLTFILQGHFIGSTSVKRFYIAGYGIRDSVEISKNGTFRYNGVTETAQSLLLSADGFHDISIWATSGTITLTLKESNQDASNPSLNSISIVSVNGPKEAKDYDQLLDTLVSFNNSIKRSRISPEDPALTRFFPILKKYIKANPKSYLPAYFAELYQFTLAQKKELLSLLGNAPNKYEIAIIKKQISRLEIISPGNIATDFQMMTPTKDIFTFHSLKSKLTLLQFWASSCLPCRWEHPDLIKLYNQYKEKGFEIVGISVDNDANDWAKAIQEDHLPWANVSDLKGWKNELAVKYKLNFLPFNILIDSSHKIIASELWPIQLKPYLEHFLNQ
jgi:thiol-disulfide isomerase/thioredoxin